MENARFTLSSDLPPVECIAHLAKFVNAEPDGYDKPWGSIGSSAICGELRSNTLYLYERNLWKHTGAELSATIRADGNGSILEGIYGMKPEYFRLRKYGVWIAIVIGGPLSLLVLVDFHSGEIQRPSDLLCSRSGGLIGGIVAVIWLNIVFFVQRVSASTSAVRLRRFLIHVLSARQK